MNRAPAVTALAVVLVATSTVVLLERRSEERARSRTPEPLSSRSLYRLNSSWTTDGGERFEWKKLAGRYQVLALVFTRCPDACPLLVRDLRKIEKALPSDLASEVGFVLVSIDPEHDTPAVLRRYRGNMHLDASRWTLLNGTNSQVRELTAVLGYNYDERRDGDLTHTNFVTVLDPGGVVLRQIGGRELEAIEPAIRTARPTK